MTERPRAGKLLPGGPGLRDATVSPLSSVDAEFRRLGEALIAGIEGDHVAALVAAMDELRSAADMIPEAELSRRIGSGLVLLGSAYKQIGNHEDAVVAFRRARSLLAHVGLEDLPAEVLMPYAGALLRVGDPGRAAVAVRQTTRRGYGQQTVPLAVAVADQLAADGRSKEAQDLLREFAEATPTSSIQDDSQLIVALDRHGMAELAAVRCLALGARLDPSDDSYRETFVQAARLSRGDPDVAKHAARALATVDVEAALNILDAAAGAKAEPGMVIVRAEILALSGHIQEAERLLHGPGSPPVATDGLAAVRGLLAYLQDNYAAAAQYLTAAVEQNPDDLRSVVLLGDSVCRLPNPDPAEVAQAEGYLSRALRLGGRDGTTLSVLALVQKTQGNTAGSEESLDEAAALDDAPSWVYSQVGENSRRAGRYKQALALFEKAIARNPTDAWAIGSRGQVRAALGNVQAAVNDYAAALRRDPALVWVFDSAQEVALPASEEITPVLDALIRGAEDTGQDPSVREGAARRAAAVLVAHGDPNRALRLLEDARDYAPASPAVLISMSWVRLRDNDHAGAQADLALAAELDASLDWVLHTPWAITTSAPPLRDAMIARLHRAADDEDLPVDERVSALVDAARALGSSGEPELVGRLLERALEMDERDASVWVDYGDALASCGRYREAVAAFQRAVDLRPGDPELVASLGWARHLAGDLDSAAIDLRRALDLRGGDYRWAALELAAVLLETSPPTARQIYRELLRVDMSDVAAARGLSAVEVTEGRTGEAMAVLQRTLRHQPDDENLRRDIALLALRMEDIRLAVDMAETLVRQQKNSVIGWLTLGILHNSFGEWSDALRALESALALDPTYADALDVQTQRAWALAYDGQLGSAAAAVQQALRYHQDPYLRGQYALILHGMDDPRGQSLLEEALSLTASVARRDAGMLAHEGFCHVALGQFDEGARQLVQSLDVDPTEVATQLDLALALLAGGKTKAGHSEYHRALARVANRNPRRQVGLLRVALVDLAQVRHWFPDVADYGPSEALIANSLSRAESLVAKSKPDTKAGSGSGAESTAVSREGPGTA